MMLVKAVRRMRMSRDAMPAGASLVDELIGERRHKDGRFDAIEIIPLMASFRASAIRSCPHAARPGHGGRSAPSRQPDIAAGLPGGGIAQRGPDPALSLADCACIAAARSPDIPVPTNDRIWAALSLGIELRPMRP